MKSIPGANHGFTLIEVIVSVTILAIGIATFAQLISGALKSSILARDYTKAVTLARSKLSEASTEIYRKQEAERGTLKNDDRFRWERTVKVYLEREESPVTIYHVSVNVYFSGAGGSEKEVNLSTLVTRVSDKKNG